MNWPVDRSPAAGPWRGMSRTGRILKRMIDFLVSIVLLVLLLPAACACVLAILGSSPGPIIFTSWRLGRHGKPFRLLKFRSMYAGAPDLRNSDGSCFNSEEDSRVTPVGRFLRNTSLDELPQLLNVLRGDMSLVGPRPDQVDQLRFYTPEEKEKLLVKPGLTGLAQISGRNTVRWERRKALDLSYVRRQSILLDLKILARTIPCVLRREGINKTTSARSEA